MAYLWHSVVLYSKPKSNEGPKIIYNFHYITLKWINFPCTTQPTHLAQDELNVNVPETSLFDKNWEAISEIPLSSSRSLKLSKPLILETCLSPKDVVFVVGLIATDDLVVQLVVVLLKFSK